MCLLIIFFHRRYELERHTLQEGAPKPHRRHLFPIYPHLRTGKMLKTSGEVNFIYCESLCLPIFPLRLPIFPLECRNTTSVVITSHQIFDPLSLFFLPYLRFPFISYYCFLVQSFLNIEDIFPCMVPATILCPHRARRPFEKSILFA